MKYRNPVLAGFHPDPSICRVGNVFYLATSSFHYFPGIPLWRSDNLVDWELAGYGISRPEQMDLAGTRASRGLYAPTIREKDGRFYIVCTEVDRLGNFAITAPAIGGPWSDPVKIAVDGMDPSLFFDDDGVIYVCASCDVGGRRGITLSVIAPGSGTVRGGPRLITRGSGGRWPEGPHIYKRNGLYYLLLSEGGTEYGHMLAVFRAISPWGPYESCPRNPVLTHRNLARSPIQCVGHGDLVDDAAGNWWLVCLGVRPIGSLLLHNLGRETFLAPVSWDPDGWPIIGDNGVISLEMDGPLPGMPQNDGPAGVIQPDRRGGDGRSWSWRDDFDGARLSPEWNFIRARSPGVVAIEKGGGLVLSGGEAGLSDPLAAPAFVGRPQQSFDCLFEAAVDFDPASEKSEAGITAYYDDSYHYEAFITRHAGSRVIVLRKHVHDIEVAVATVAIPDTGCVRLSVDANRERYRFSYSCNDVGGELGLGMTAGLCSEGTWRMSFTGVFFGLFCVQGKAFFHDSSCVDLEGTSCYPRQ